MDGKWVKQLVLAVAGLGLLNVGCGVANQVSSSEVAASVVSGALNNSAGSTVAYNELRPHKSELQKAIEALNPISTALAYNLSCTGGTLSPTYSGPGSYAYTPRSCTVTWDNGTSGSLTWNSTFHLLYGSSCSATDPYIDSNQLANCSITRTTAVGGNTRTIVGPEGNAYSMTDDTHGAGTGWDSSVSPAPNDSGLIIACSASGCAAGRSLTINGSHLSGQMTPKGGSAETVWDHTVSTPTAPLTVAGVGTGRVVNGSVTVQHNLIKETAVVTFNNVTFGEAGCCFPTAGSLSTSITAGKYAGKSESLTFTTTCGQADFVSPSGASSTITLKHCL